MNVASGAPAAASPAFRHSEEHQQAACSTGKRFTLGSWVQARGGLQAGNMGKVVAADTIDGRLRLDILGNVFIQKEHVRGR